MIKEKKNNLTINQKRILSRYEREIRRIVFEIEKNYNSPSDFIPISFCEVDKKFQVLKVFLAFEEDENNLDLVSKINKNFSSIARYELGKVKFFSRVPKVLFVIDKNFGYIKNVEKLLKEN